MDAKPLTETAKQGALWFARYLLGLGAALVVLSLLVWATCRMQSPFFWGNGLLFLLVGHRMLRDLQA